MSGYAATFAIEFPSLLPRLICIPNRTRNGTVLLRLRNFLGRASSGLDSLMAEGYGIAFSIGSA
jgi:hypothetical protein